MITTLNFFCCFFLTLFVGLTLTSPSPREIRNVFPGISYLCEYFEEPGIKGLVHVVHVDLKTPGIEIYTTPLDPVAMANGYDYRTDWVTSVVESEHLAVAINGTLFAKQGPKWAFWAGQNALAGETLISNGEINRIDPHSYLLWFEDDLTPHLEKKKPPPAESCKRAKWGIGGQVVAIDSGKVSKYLDDESFDRRTLIGFDSEKRLLSIGVFDNCSSAAAAMVFVRYGVKNAIPLDGGSSASLVFGKGAVGVPASNVVCQSTSVANVFGVRFHDPNYQEMVIE